LVRRFLQFPAFPRNTRRASVLSSASQKLAAGPAV
jgi:hypothetical protein